MTDVLLNQSLHVLLFLCTKRLPQCAAGSFADLGELLLSLAQEVLGALHHGPLGTRIVTSIPFTKALEVGELG